MEGTISILMPSQIHERVKSVQMQQTEEGVFRAALDAVTLTLTSFEAVVAAHETSQESCDFKEAGAMRDNLKAQFAQREYLQQSPIAK